MTLLGAAFTTPRFSPKVWRVHWLYPGAAPATHPWPFAVQPQWAHAWRHVATLQPACRAAAPVGCTCLALVLASVLWVTPRWLWAPAAHTQTSVQGTRSMPGHPLPPASAVFQRLNWRGDEAELLIVALFLGLGFADRESPGHEGGRCLRRGHTNPLRPGGPPCPTPAPAPWGAAAGFLPIPGRHVPPTCPQEGL